MKHTRNHVLVLVTAPNLKTAHRLTKSILTGRLAACVNLMPKVESHYWWQGNQETSAEVLMIIKTTTGKLKELETAILAGHPYETPEFVVLPIKAGSRDYLAWLSASVRSS